MSKLDNFPPVYWLSLPNSKERQESAINEFEKYEIKNHTMVLGYDAKENDLTNHSLVSGVFLHQMSSCDVACAISHLKMIREWYYNSDTPYAMFFEDDINFEDMCGAADRALYFSKNSGRNRATKFNEEVINEFEKNRRSWN